MKDWHYVIGKMLEVVNDKDSPHRQVFETYIKELEVDLEDFKKAIKFNETYGALVTEDFEIPECQSHIQRIRFLFLNDGNAIDLKANIYRVDSIFEDFQKFESEDEFKKPKL